MVAKLERHNALTSAAGTTSAALQNSGAAPLECPRCESTNTKFCYYNNYSLAQPRHFCKACKRYWTRGGTLRNVPVGGGCRKNKRATKTRSPVASYAPRKAPPSTNSLPPFLYDLPPANSSNNLLDLQAQLAGYEENFQLAHHQHSMSAAFLGGYSLFMNSDQLPSSSPAAAEISYQPFLFYDHDHHPILESDQNLGFNIPRFAEENPIHSFGATAEPSYLYWPEPGPSAAPLH